MSKIVGIVLLTIIGLVAIHHYKGKWKVWEELSTKKAQALSAPTTLTLARKAITLTSTNWIGVTCFATDCTRVSSMLTTGVCWQIRYSNRSRTPGSPDFEEISNYPTADGVIQDMWPADYSGPKLPFRPKGAYNTTEYRVNPSHHGSDVAAVLEWKFTSP
jgi:hypothetical protein